MFGYNLVIYKSVMGQAILHLFLVYGKKYFLVLKLFHLETTSAKQK